jgi:two-component system response regulator HydG
VGENVQLSILIVDDEPAIRKVFTDVVAVREGVLVHEAPGAKEALQLLRSTPVDIAFVDLYMPGVGGMDLLERLRKERPALEIVMVTAHGTVESAVQALKMGASDYLQKPFKLDHVSLLLERLRRVRRLQAENVRLRNELQERYRAQSLVGLTPAMDRCNELIDRVRRDDCTVLLLGESGSGKELAARAIHYEGSRRDRPFVAIDCGALQPSLIESELFGHVKGAFTGADEDRVGLFEMASGGTAFLDEVGEIPLALQPSLLRTLEEKEVRPLGATGARAVDVRIIAATNRPLEAMVEEGTFRRDLYYRLNVVTIRMPPLRERRDDIPLLVEHFLQKNTRRGRRSIARVAPSALEALSRYAWPGNVRELEHALEHACTLGRGDQIEVGDLPAAVVHGSPSRGTPEAESIEDMEVRAIRKLLDDHRGDTARVAAILGIDRSTLYRKMKRYAIKLRTGTRRKG